jgi:hypothetical protein
MVAMQLLTSVPESKDAARHRRDIQRYRYFLDFLHDPEMSRILKQQLKEAEEQLAEIERTCTHRHKENS